MIRTDRTETAATLTLGGKPRISTWRLEVQKLTATASTAVGMESRARIFPVRPSRAAPPAPLLSLQHLDFY